MNYLPFALLAYLLNAVAVTVDKFLLAGAVPNPLAYVFYISAVSLFAVILLPLTHIPSFEVFNLASASTLLWTSAAYFMFKALKVGQISRVIPVIGTLTPLILLTYAAKTSSITVNETWAAGILILGLIIITSESWIGKIKKEELFYEALAALLFASSYIILKQAFEQGNFLQVLVYSRFILVPFGVIILLIPILKKQVLTAQTFNFKNRAMMLFAAGQLLGGGSQLLLNFSVSLASPALISSLQGTQYVFLLGSSLMFSSKFPKIFKEEAGLRQMAIKILGVSLIALGLYILAFSQQKSSPNLGITFSAKYAQQLGLDQRQTFIKIMDDLKVKKVRIPIYWDEVEQFPGKFRFEGYDFYVLEAQKRGVQVILVLGYKQPRWPECFAPAWVKNLMRKEREERILDLLEREVLHFRGYSNILAWQIENEPFLSYGVCDPVNQQTRQLVKKEVELVKSLDSRPVLITDSGELSLWVETLKHSDWFGLSLYRTVWDRYLGLIDYPLPPFFYTLKEKVVRTVTGKNGPTIISELQAEPWITKRASAADTDIAEQAKLMPVEKLRGNVEFAKETGFSQIYLWGVEWWYFMDKNGYPKYWQYAKSLFNIQPEE